MANWARLGNVWLPIASLAKDYDGPVVLADATQTVQWFSEHGGTGPVDHPEHQQDEGGAFLFDKGKPVTKSRKVDPAFWSPAVVSD